MVDLASVCYVDLDGSHTSGLSNAPISICTEGVRMPEVHNVEAVCSFPTVESTPTPEDCYAMLHTGSPWPQHPQAHFLYWPESFITNDQVIAGGEAAMPEWQKTQFHQPSENQAQQFLQQQLQRHQWPPQPPVLSGCPGVVMLGAANSEDYFKPSLHGFANDLRTHSAPPLIDIPQGMVIMSAPDAVTLNHTAASPCLSLTPLLPMSSSALCSYGLPGKPSQTRVMDGSLAHPAQALHMNGQEASSVLKKQESTELYIRGNPQHTGAHQAMRDAARSDCVTTQCQSGQSRKSTEAVSKEARSAEGAHGSRKNIVEKIQVLNLLDTLFSDSKQQLARDYNCSARDYNCSESVSCSQLASVSLNVTGFQSPTSGIHRFAWTVETRRVKGGDSQIISPPFEIGATTSSFKMMILPKVSYHGKGGASFQKAKGKGLVQLKRWKSKDPAPEAPHDALRFWISVGNAEKRGPVEHDFTGRAVACLPERDEVWDFSKAIEEASGTFVVKLDAILSNA